MAKGSGARGKGQPVLCVRLDTERLQRIDGDRTERGLTRAGWLRRLVDRELARLERSARR